MQRSKRPMGVEPTSPAWEAGVMPLYDDRIISKNSKVKPLSSRLETSPGPQSQTRQSTHIHLIYDEGFYVRSPGFQLPCFCYS